MRSRRALIPRAKMPSSFVSRTRAIALTLPFRQRLLLDR
jgi:hypothetical protein